MSKGSPYVPIRIPQELLERIKAQISMTNRFTRDEEYTLSEWLRKAAEEKLRKMVRSRRPRNQSSVRQIGLTEEKKGES